LEGVAAKIICSARSQASDLTDRDLGGQEVGGTREHDAKTDLLACLPESEACADRWSRPARLV
jgi:hypothetical protein